MCRRRLDLKRTRGSARIRAVELFLVLFLEGILGDYNHLLSTQVHSRFISKLPLPVLLVTSEFCYCSIVSIPVIYLLQCVRYPYIPTQFRTDVDPSNPRGEQFAARFSRAVGTDGYSCGDRRQGSYRADRFHAKMPPCGRDDDGNSTAANVPDFAVNPDPSAFGAATSCTYTGSESPYGRRQTDTIASDVCI